jgi:hypothetical protein
MKHKSYYNGLSLAHTLILSALLILLAWGCEMLHVLAFLKFLLTGEK